MNRLAILGEIFFACEKIFPRKKIRVNFQLKLINNNNNTRAQHNNAAFIDVIYFGTR